MQALPVLLTTLFAVLGGARILPLIGVNIGGCDIGIDADGKTYPQLGQNCTTNANARIQMTHFVKDWNMNIFRIPVAWQSLVNCTLGGPLDPTFTKKYDDLIQICLGTGSYCIIDIHNYARWNGEIIGQSTKPGGPTDDHLISVWSQLAKKYASVPKIIFGIMNEPHELDIARWAQTVQKVVLAIRKQGATSQTVLLPGTDYTLTYTVYTKSGPYLQTIKDYDGSNSNLWFDVHQYFQANGTPEGKPCVSDLVNEQFVPATNWLKKNGRYALVTEVGGINDDTCAKYVCSALDYLNANGAVWRGWTGFTAGGLPGNNYSLSLTPFANGTDRYLVQKCFGPKTGGF